MDLATLRTAVKDKRLYTGKVGGELCPAVEEAIDDKITGDRTTGEIEKEVVVIEQEDPVRRHLVRSVKVMVSGFDHQSTFATLAIVADQHRGFRIHR